METEQKHNVQIQVDTSVGLVRISEHIAIPSRFTARIDDLAFPYILTLQIAAPFVGRPRCVGMQVDPRLESEFVDGAGLRSLRLGKIVDLCCRAASFQIKPTNSPEHVLVSALPVELNNAFQEAWQENYGREKRKRGISDDDLREVARLYREALQSDNSASTKFVAHKMNVSRSTAARWVQKARSQGLIGPAIGSKAGEAT